MVRFRVLIIVLFLSFVWIGCEKDSGNSAVGGAPGDSPADIAANDNVPGTGTLSGIPGDGDNSPGVGEEVDLGDDDAEDLADGDSDEDDDDGDDDDGDDDDGEGSNGGDEGVADDDIDGESAKCADRSIALDTSYGRWFETPKKSLVSKENYAKTVSQIKDLRKEIKDLKKDKKSKGANLSRIKLKIRELRLQIRQLRDTIGYGKNQKGIHTYWSNENLYLRVRNNCKAGWYKLIVVAKNVGDLPLPDFYQYYNISVRNEDNGEALGGIHVESSDSFYHRGRMLVNLKQGDTDLNLLWTNDAYKKGEYDANIQIKRVILKYKGQKGPRRRLVRSAHQYSFVEGKWFWDDNSVRTYWGNNTLGFSFNNLQAGKYNVIVHARNYGILPPNYKAFNVSIESGDGVSASMEIPADENKYKKGQCTLDLTGPNTLYLTWTNDVYKKGEYDSNIQIKKIVLKRLGKSERSALAAYLVTKASRNKPIILIFLSVVVTLGGIFIWNKKKSKA